MQTRPFLEKTIIQRPKTDIGIQDTARDAQERAFPMQMFSLDPRHGFNTNKET